MTHTSIRLLGMLLLISMVSGCATLAGESTQKLNIQTVDAEGSIVEGMSCHVSNASRELCRRHSDVRYADAAILIAIGR